MRVRALLIAVLLLGAADRPSAQTIPVVVHIISRDPDSITDQKIRLAIEDLNDAFAHSGLYQPLGAGVNTGIRFCLARRDPMGGNTTGITRTRHELADFDKDVEDKRLKDLVIWDPRQYLNIWYVEVLKNEMNPLFSCSEWERSDEPGYATFNPGESDDGVVVTRFGRVLAHNVGHYLGLSHIFSFRSCKNDDCAVDGDGICDTPPASRASLDCNPGPNTCSTDTLPKGGFTTDMPDLPGNFMNTTLCTWSFTNGQAFKMKSILATLRGSLLVGDRCTPPCPQPVKADFRRDKWFPVPGDTIRFVSTDSDGMNYQWSVNGTPVGTNSTTYEQVFPATGRFEVALKVYNADTACFASRTDRVAVTCGVMARFFPDKRVIASKAPLMLESVYFTNRSIGATTYKWLLSHVDSTRESVVDTNPGFTYIFPDSGRYWVRLAAFNGGCTDTSNAFRIQVIDPTPDAVPQITAECYQDTLLKVTVRICNGGYAKIPAGFPISFYDGNPLAPGSRRVDTTFLLPDTVKGICCGDTYTLLLRTGGRRLDSLFVVANDRGSSTPVTLGPAFMPELYYDNNIRHLGGLRFRAAITPPSSILSAFETTTFSASSRPVTPGTTYRWSAAETPGCITCPSTSYTAGIRKDTLRLHALSRYGCRDSAIAPIRVRPVHDYLVRIDSIDCFKPDSLVIDFTVCDTFRLGKLPRDLSVSFFDADPRLPGSRKLGTSFLTPGATARCAGYRTVVGMVKPDRTVFAVVNDDVSGPSLLPTDTLFFETDYDNNYDSITYRPEQIILQPSDTLVLRKSILPVSITPRVHRPSTIAWQPAPGQMLSCSTACAVTRLTPFLGDTLRVSMSNRHGCTLRTQAVVRILPPDFSVDITATHCYAGTGTLIRFRICIADGYDSLPAGLPVSFYSVDPRSAVNVSPIATFSVPAIRPQGCDTFSLVVPTPASMFLLASVNQRRSARFPDIFLPESRLDNNFDTSTLENFSVRVLPKDTFVTRLGSLRLTAEARGGTVAMYAWQPAQLLSCASCPMPIATVPFTTRFTLVARSPYGCSHADTVVVRTFVDGKVQIPNAFTPNGDGRNDRLYVIGNRDIAKVREFTVYDRYGQVVFQARDVPPNDAAFGWDGRRNGIPVTSGSFAYSILLQMMDESVARVKGIVTVIR